MFLLRRIPWFLLGLLLIGAAWSLRPASDTDLLWHLRAGEWMLAHGQVIRQDIFSVTRWGTAWISIPWLHEILLVKLRDHLGYAGIAGLQMLATAALTVEVSVLAWLLRRRGAWDWRWPFLSVPAILSLLLTLRLYQMRINGRPEMHTYVLLAADLVILVAYAQGGARGWHRLLPAVPPLLQIGWVNTHGAFIFGPLAVGAFAAGAWMQAIFRPRGERRREIWKALQLTLSTLLTALACLATPYGIAGALYPLHLFQVLTDRVYSESIMEGRPVDLSLVMQSGHLGYALLACWVFAGLGLLGRLLEQTSNVQRSTFRVQRYPPRSTCRPAPSPLPLGYIGMVACMAYVSLTAIRNVPLLPIVAAPLMAGGVEFAADGLAGLLGRLTARWRQLPASAHAAAAVAWLHGRRARLVGRLALALGLVLLYRAIVSERFYETLGWRTRVAAGFSDHEHPLAAMEFLARQRPALPRLVVCGDTRSANTLLWRFGPAWLTYFDGRHAEIYDPALFRVATASRGDPQVFAREAATYGIGLASFALADQGERVSPLAHYLWQPTNGWGLVYLDDCAALFLRRSPQTEELVNRLRLPPAPTGAAEQRELFAAWLRVQGRQSLADLDDPGNHALSRNAFVNGVTRLLQAGGWWSPRREPRALRDVRLAAWLDELGWRVVADDLYDAAILRTREPNRLLPLALRHALRVYRDSDAASVQAAMRTRIRERMALLERTHPADILVGYASACLVNAEGRPSDAVRRLRVLARRVRDTDLYDLLIPALLAAGDTSTAPENERLWKEAVEDCRLRLAERDNDAYAPRVHRWLAELADRLGEPALAAANRRLADKTALRLRNDP